MRCYVIRPKLFKAVERLQIEPKSQQQGQGWMRKRSGVALVLVRSPVRRSHAQMYFFLTKVDKLPKRAF